MTNKKVKLAAVYSSNPATGTAFARTSSNKYLRIRVRDTQDRITLEKVSKEQLPSSAKKVEVKTIKNSKLNSYLNPRFTW